MKRNAHHKGKDSLRIVATCIATFFLLSSISTVLALAQQENFHEQRRVVVFTEQEAKKALQHGCKIHRQTHTLKALLCSKNTARKLKLREDIEISGVNAVAAEAIGATHVHQAGTTGRGVTIAVLDTGYNYNHPELKSSYQGGYDFYNGDDDPFDDHGHGSHVAGTITADGIETRARGISPDAQILSLKVLNSENKGYLSDVVAAIYWSVDGPDGIHGTSDDFNIDVISMSLGTSAPKLFKETCDDFFPPLTEVILYAKQQGILVVAAAGNYGLNGVSVPGCISEVITVGATLMNGTILESSGRGSSIDLVAPGANLYSTWISTDYIIQSGTSMATPAVSATVALMKQSYPKLTIQDIESILKTTAIDLGATGRDFVYGFGSVSASEAVAAAERLKPRSVYNCTELEEEGAVYVLENDLINSPTREACLKIKARNITINGNGFALRGQNSGNGILDDGFNNLKVYNIVITNFHQGIVLDGVENVLINQTTLINNEYGASGSPVSNSRFEKVSFINNDHGLWLFYPTSINNEFIEMTFLNNIQDAAL